MNTPSDLSGPSSSRRGWLKSLGGLLTGGLLLGRSRTAKADTASVNGTTIFLGEIMMISWGYAPRGFAFCNGQLLSIAQNQALFALLGTTYGGNGQTTFALPDLRGRIPVSDGGSFTLGQRGGTEVHPLTLSQLVPHIHGIKSSTSIGSLAVSGTSSPVAHHYLADSGGGAPQYGNAPNTTLSTIGAGGTTVNVSSNNGSGQAHLNMQPFTCINFVIATQGIFPSQV